MLCYVVGGLDRGCFIRGACRAEIPEMRQCRGECCEGHVHSFADAVRAFSKSIVADNLG